MKLSTEVSTLSDFLVRDSWSELDPQTYELNEIEAERQHRKLILIASESTAPLAVREALNSAFNNIYAEGYPDDDTRRMTQDEILDYEARLAHYRRYGGPRYYKGVEYADTVEALARRRCAELFANDLVSVEDMLVNVQALSGGPANNAVYHALVEPGDTVMGMNLLHGGHLSHGARVNRSGKYYQSVSYGIDPETEQIDYNAVRILAHQHKPKMIIAGCSSYPWMIDWMQFRAIADDVGAYLLADMAHVAGLVAAEVHPSPIGVAHVVTFTTHKSLCGPRGACIVTTVPELASKIDRAVFPGEQGGPHINTMLSMAVMFKLNNSEKFRALQAQVKANARYFSDQMASHGFRIPYGGTDTHLFNVDCKSVTGPRDVPLMGEVASRILDLAGIVVNRNTIPGDKGALNPSGLRIGTVWITQRGFRETEVEELSRLMAELLLASVPYASQGAASKRGYRAKVDFEVLNDVRVGVRELANNAANDFEISEHRGYPHFYRIDSEPSDTRSGGKWRVLVMSGSRVQAFLQQVTTNDVAKLAIDSKAQRSLVLEDDGRVLDDVYLQRVTPDPRGRDRYLMAVHDSRSVRLKAWLRGLSDGYVICDRDDLWAKVEGPAVIQDMRSADVSEDIDNVVQRLIGTIEEDYVPLSYPEDRRLKGEEVWRAGHVSLFSRQKTYFVGRKSLRSVAPESEKSYWAWDGLREPVDGSEDLKESCLYDEHCKLTRHMAPFAGWKMPLWYSSATEEHRATRMGAALFDVTHMGVFGVSGPYATEFLDTVSTNYVGWLEDGWSQYSYLLDCDANVIDDILIYRLRCDDYILVVNAANADKDWDWLKQVNRGEVVLDSSDPLKQVLNPVQLRDLKDPIEGPDQKVDIALQGPNSLAILQRLAGGKNVRRMLEQVPRTGLIETEIAGLEVVVARTGYTGEAVGYEMFVHPDAAPLLWNAVLDSGDDLGVKPAGLAARDSTRIEAGLPLYGHELAGPHNINPFACGFGAYVKLHKPFFVGRKECLEKVVQNDVKVIRYRMNEGHVRPPRSGDPVVDRRGRMIGWVTSSASDSAGGLIGQAYVSQKHSKPGTTIGIFQAASDKQEPPRSDLKLGDRVQLHSWAEVLPRFMRSRS